MHQIFHGVSCYLVAGVKHNLTAEFIDELEQYFVGKIELLLQAIRALIFEALLYKRHKLN